MITSTDWTALALQLSREGKSVAEIHRTLDRWFLICLAAGATDDSQRITPRLNKEQTK